METEKKIKLSRPVGKDIRISSPFGNRIIKGSAEFHKGIDFACPVGTEIKAVEDGVIERSGWEDAENPTKGYGLRVMQKILVDGELFWIWYGHLSEVMVKVGDKVVKGQVVGLSGNTGRSTGPHLHFGVRKSNTGDFYDVEWLGSDNDQRDGKSNNERRREDCISEISDIV